MRAGPHLRRLRPGGRALLGLQLALAMALVAVAPPLLESRLRSALIEATGTRLVREAGSLRERVVGYVENRVADLRLLSLDAAARETLRLQAAAAPPSAAPPGPLADRLDAFVRLRPELVSVQVVGSAGRVVAATSPEGMDRPSGASPWFRALSLDEIPRPFVRERPGRNGSAPWALEIAYPVYDVDGKRLGAVHAVLDGTGLRPLLEQSRTGRTGHALLLRSLDGLVLLAGNGDQEGSQTYPGYGDLQGTVRVGGFGLASRFEDPRRPAATPARIVGQSRVEELRTANWAVVVDVTLAEAMEPWERVRGLAWAGAGLTQVLLLLLALGLLRGDRPPHRNDAAAPDEPEAAREPAAPARRSRVAGRLGLGLLGLLGVAVAILWVTHASVAHAPKSYMEALLRGRQAYDEGNHQKAEELFRDGKPLGETRRALARAYALQGELAKAEPLYRPLIEAPEPDPHDGDLWSSRALEAAHNLAILYHRAGRYADADGLLRRTIPREGWRYLTALHVAHRQRAPLWVQTPSGTPVRVPLDYGWAILTLSHLDRLASDDGRAGTAQQAYGFLEALLDDATRLRAGVPGFLAWYLLGYVDHLDRSGRREDATRIWEGLQALHARGSFGPDGVHPPLPCIPYWGEIEDGCLLELHEPPDTFLVPAATPAPAARSAGLATTRPLAVGHEASPPQELLAAANVAWREEDYGHAAALLELAALRAQDAEIQWHQIDRLYLAPLANAYTRLGRLSEAEQVLARLAERRPLERGLLPVQIGIAHNLAVAYYHQGDLRRSERLLGAALDPVRNQTDSRHVYWLILSHLDGVYTAQRRHEEARAVCQHLLSQLERLRHVGANEREPTEAARHLLFARLLPKYAVSLRIAGRRDDAERLENVSRDILAWARPAVSGTAALPECLAYWGSPPGACLLEMYDAPQEHIAPEGAERPPRDPPQAQDGHAKPKPVRLTLWERNSRDPVEAGPLEASGRSSGGAAYVSSSAPPVQWGSPAKGLLAKLVPVALGEGTARLLIGGEERTLHVGDTLGTDVVKSITENQIVLERPATVDPTLGQCIVIVRFDRERRPRVQLISSRLPTRPPPPPPG